MNVLFFALYVCAHNVSDDILQQKTLPRLTLFKNRKKSRQLTETKWKICTSHSQLRVPKPR